MARKKEDENKRVCSNCGRPLAVTDYDGLCEECREELEKEAKKKKAQQDTGEDDENIRAEEEEEERRRKQQEEEDDDNDDDYDDDNDDEHDDDVDDDDNQEEEEQEDNNDDDDKNKKDRDKKDKDDKDEKEKKDDEGNETQKNKEGENTPQEERADKPKPENEPEPSTPNPNQPSQPGQPGPPAGGTEAGTAGGAEAGGVAAGETGAAAGGTAGTAGGTAGTAAAGTAGTAGTAAAGTAGTAGTAAGTAAAAGGTSLAVVLFWVIVIILVIIAIIGIIVFFVMMPGMVVGRIGEAINDLWIKEKIFVNGGRADQILVTRSDVADTAEYLSQMGYDLQGYGFLSRKDSSGNLIQVSKSTKMTAKVNSGTLATLRDAITDWDTFNTSNLPLSDFKKDSIQDRKREDPNSEYAIVYVREPENQTTQPSENQNEEEENINSPLNPTQNNNNEEGLSDSVWKNRIVMVTDEDGTVKFAMSANIGQYLATDESTYLVRNYNLDLTDRLPKLIGMTPSEADGCGLLYFAQEEADGIKASDYIEGVGNLKFVNAERSLSDLFGGKVTKVINFLKPSTTLMTEAKFFDLVQVDKSSKVMRIYNGNDGWFRTSYSDYNMDGWASRYGIPLQLSLTVHLSTLAPDFAFKFAQIASVNKADDPNTEADESKGSTVEIGLLEVPENYVKSKLLLDLGEGEKYYYIEKKVEAHMHYSKSGDEDGYDTIEEAEKNNDSDEFSGERGEEDFNEKAKYPDLTTVLDEYENQLKNAGYSSTNRKVAGSLVYRISGSRKPDNCPSLPTNMYRTDAQDFISDYYYTIEDETLSKIYKTLIQYGQIDGKTNRVPEAVIRQKVMSIITTYYKIKPIEESMHLQITNNKVTQVSWDNVGPTIRSAMSNGNLSFVGRAGYYDLYKGKEDVYGNVVVNESAMYGSGTLNGDGFVGHIYGQATSRQYAMYGNGDMLSLYYIYIERDLGNIAIKEPMFDIQAFIEKVFPFRVYYRLVDEDGNPAPLSRKDKSNEAYDSYTYTTEGAEKAGYWPNDPENKDGGWFWRKSIPNNLIDQINAKVTDDNDKVDASDVKKLLDNMYEYNIGQDDKWYLGDYKGFTKYIPVILEVKHHWYRDISFKGCYEWDTSEVSQKRTYPLFIDEEVEYGDANNADPVIRQLNDYDILWIEEDGPGAVVQTKDGKRVGGAGEEVKKLLYNDDGSDKLYYKYNGSERSEEKSKIEFDETAVDAIAMLEQIEGEDAQHIIRDYKSLMKSFGIFFESKGNTNLKKELFSKVVEGFTNKEQILPEGDDSVIRANIPPSQYGFTTGVNVMSPANGRITYRTDDSVCIEISAPGEKLDKYTVLIEGFDVGEDINVGMTLTEGTVVGKTKRKDIKLTLRDENGAIVKNSYTAGPQEYQAQPDDEYRLAALMHHEFCAASGYVYNAKVRDEEGDWVYARDREDIGGGLTDISRTCGYVLLNNCLKEGLTIEEYINAHPEAYGSAGIEYNNANENSGNWCETCLENAKWCLKYDCGSVVSSEGIPMTRNCTTQSQFDIGCSAWAQPNTLARWWLIDANGDDKITDNHYYNDSMGAMDSFFLRETSSEYEADAEPVVEYDDRDLQTH